MSNVTRITVSIDEPLLEQFEKFLTDNGYPTRSEGVKSIMRKALIENEWQSGTEVAATISLVYDHHKPGVMQKLVDIQHDFGELVICTQHVHLDHHNCMEVLIVKGLASRIRDFHVALKSVKGLKHCTLSAATTGEDIH